MLDYSQEEKEIFMSEALKEAQKSLDKAEIPIGCVIVKDKEIVGRGHNAREELNQAIMHAEVMVLRLCKTFSARAANAKKKPNDWLN